MRDWRTAPLKDFLTRITYGFTNPMPTTDEGPYKVTARDINGGRILYEQARSTSDYAYRNDITDKSRPDIGDVLVTKDGTLGRVAIVDRGDVCINQSVALLKPSVRIRSRFLKYLLEEPTNFARMIGDADGTTIKHIYVTRLGKMLVRVPELSRQDGIVTILGALDDKIDLNRRMNETLEAMARAIFKDWFVDFGPTRAKAEGREPYLAPELWDLFPDALDDEGKPVGWKIGNLGDFFRLTMGQSPPGSTYNSDLMGLPFFQGRTDFGFRYPENRMYCTAPTRIAERDDTLVSVRAPVGDINMAWERCCPGRGVAALRHMSGSRSFTYYSVWAIQQELRQYENTGTVFGAVNKGQFEALSVVEPTPEIISLFESKVGPLDELIKRNFSGSRMLSQTRDLLLPKLMSGEVRLRYAEKAVEAVT